MSDKSVRDIINSILEKIGVEDAADLPDKRATDKLSARLDSDEPLPDTLTVEEKEFIKSILDSEEEETTEDADVDATEETETEEKPVKKSSGKKDIKPAKSKKVDPKAEKPAKAEKAPKADAKPKTIKTDKAEKKAKKGKRGMKRGSRGGGAAVMYKTFGYDVEIGKIKDKTVQVLVADLMYDLVKGGMGEASAASYISWAQRTKMGEPNKNCNPFGFVLKKFICADGKNKGQKMLKIA